jgi:hypothetical protein
MEKVNARRGFLKGFGLGAAVIGGFASAGAANAVSVVGSSVPVDSDQPKRVDRDAVEDISHLAPRDGIVTLQISGDNRPPQPPKPSSYCSVDGSSYTIISGSSYVSNPLLSYGAACPSNELNNVSMAVGKDDRLWIRVGDSWKRVALEN